MYVSKYKPHLSPCITCSSLSSTSSSSIHRLMVLDVVHINKNIFNSYPAQGRVEGWDAMKPLHYRSMSSKGAGRPRLMHHHRGGWNEMKWMRWGWRNGGMKLVVGENGRNPVENLPRPRFVHHETHMEGPRREFGTPAVGGEHLTACATRPPVHINKTKHQIKAWNIWKMIILFDASMQISSKFWIVFETKMEGEQSGTYLRQARASSSLQVSIAKTYTVDEMKRKWIFRPDHSGLPQQ